MYTYFIILHLYRAVRFYKMAGHRSGAIGGILPDSPHPLRIRVQRNAAFVLECEILQRRNRHDSESILLLLLSDGLPVVRWL